MGPVKQCLLGCLVGVFVVTGTCLALQYKDKDKAPVYFNVEQHWKSLEMRAMAIAETDRKAKKAREMSKKYERWLNAQG